MTAASDRPSARALDLLPRVAQLLVEAATGAAGLAGRLASLAGDGAVRLDLASEVEPHTGARHDDVLLTERDGGTFLLSYAPADQQPWVLRGAQRWSDGDLLRVDDQLVRVRDALAIIEVLWKDARLCRQLISHALMRSRAKAEGCTVRDDELTDFVQRFRRTRRLFAAADFEAWLKSRGLSLPQFMEQAADHARLITLRRRHVAARADDHFQQHRRAFDRFTVAEWRFADRDACAEARRDLLAGDFWARARSGASLPTFRTVHRRDLPAEIAHSDPVDGLVGPVAVDGGVALFAILQRRDAELDAATRATIEGLLEEEWLAELRARARVEWNWGETAATPR